MIRTAPASTILVALVLLFVTPLRAEDARDEALSTPLDQRAQLPALEYEGDAPRVQLPLAPADSRRLMVVPEGFDVQLFAAEPDIVNPLALAWDERGRLFVAESLDYPHELHPDGGGRDRITLCEDTDGDGRADRFTRFATGLSIVTSLVCARDGLIVTQAPHVLYLADTDGDDVADVREVLFSGFGTFDTHAGPSSLRYGMDGWIWGAVGYSGFEASADAGREKFAMGVFRFTPDGAKFEAVGGFDNNTWGLGLTEDFEVFGSTANNNHSAFVGIPWRYEDAADTKRTISPTIQGHYEVHPITTDVQQVDVRGGFTAAAGHNIYTAHDYPEYFWNKVALVNEPTAHLVHMARLEPAGAGYKEDDGGNLVASADAWFAPVFADVGPDGQVWIADWYNPVIQHNPDKRGADNQIWNDRGGPGNAHVNPRRDQTHGRIWRVVSTAKQPDAAPLLDRTDPDTLVAGIEHSNAFWRTQALRLLLEEQHVDSAHEVVTLIEDARADSPGSVGTAITALWAVAGLGGLDEDENPFTVETVHEALMHAEASIRKNTALVLPATTSSAEALASSRLMFDPDLATRRVALLRAADLPNVPELSEQLLVAALDLELAADPWLVRALQLAEQHYSRAPEQTRTAIAATAEEQPQPWRLTMQAPGEGWHLPEFDDSTWVAKNSGFGRGGTPGARVGFAWHEHEIWIRRQFEVGEALLSTPGEPVLRIHHDEDAIVFVNGVLAAELSGYTTAYVDVPLTPAAAAALKAGTNTLAVYCHQTIGGQFIDVGLTLLENSSADSAPASAPPADITLELGALRGTIAYDQELLTVPAGASVNLVFTNNDVMPHNLVLLEAGSLQRFGAAVDAFLADPRAMERNFVPESDDTIGGIRMLMSGESDTLSFTAPTEPGDYPYVCTFPGHWRLMNGVLRVTGATSIPQVLLVGGGSSHDYARWVGDEDANMMRRGGFAATHYTEDLDTLADTVREASVLLLSNNSPLPVAAREAVFAHVAAGRALVLCHAATWYNWRDWPEYNEALVGGGAESHEAYGEFEVFVADSLHPLAAGLPTRFKITDELYRFVPDPAAAKIHVIATGHSMQGTDSFPVLWTVEHEQARIVCTTLGHDGASHEHPAYKLLMHNILVWSFDE